MAERPYILLITSDPARANCMTCTTLPQVGMA